MFHRFVNGFRSPLNISTNSQILGFIAPFKVSNNTSVRQGKYVFLRRCVNNVYYNYKYVNIQIHWAIVWLCLDARHLSITLNLDCLFLMWILCLSRTDFIIENAEVGKCTYTMQLGFGSSYTVLIPSNYRIDTNVSHDSTTFQMPSRYIKLYDTLTSSHCHLLTTNRLECG